MSQSSEHPSSVPRHVTGKKAELKKQPGRPPAHSREPICILTQTYGRTPDGEVPPTTGNSWVSALGAQKTHRRFLYPMLRLKPRPAKLPGAGIRIAWAHPWGFLPSTSGTEPRNLHFEQFSAHGDAAGPRTTAQLQLLWTFCPQSCHWSHTRDRI